jgi:hypothetical protein
MECAKASSKLAEALVVAEEKSQLLQRVAQTLPGRPALSQPASNLKPTSATKKIPREVDKMAKAVAPEVGLFAK